MDHYVKIERADNSLIACVSMTGLRPDLGPRQLLAHAIRHYVETGGCGLMGLYAHRVDFGPNFNFNSCDLRHATLYGAKLQGAQFGNADLTDIDLGGADLRGADFDYVHNLTGADFRYAQLNGADLGSVGLTRCRFEHAKVDGAKYRGTVLRRHIASVDRSDDYTFHAFQLQNGLVMIAAGCRWMTIPEYRRHIAIAYDDLRIGDETKAILDFLEARARHLGIDASRAGAAPIDADDIPL